MCNDSLYGNYRTRTFCEIFGVTDETTQETVADYTVFENYFNESPFADSVKPESLEKIFYLLYSYYGNSHISSSDETQFKFKLFSIIFMYGGIWEKKLEIQKGIRSLDINSPEVLLGSTTIYNHSYNPSTEPDTNTTDVLPTIDDQNVTKFKRTKLEAYARMYDMISNDVTKSFIDKFKTLFLTVVEPQYPLFYVSDN